MAALCSLLPSLQPPSNKLKPKEKCESGNLYFDVWDSCYQVLKEPEQILDKRRQKHLVGAYDFPIAKCIIMKNVMPFHTIEPQIRFD